jgi:hypothetical protein
VEYVLFIFCRNTVVFSETRSDYVYDEISDVDILEVRYVCVYLFLRFEVMRKPLLPYVHQLFIARAASTEGFTRRAEWMFAVVRYIFINNSFVRSF